MPWMKRATTSTDWLSATPQASEAAVKRGESGEEDVTTAKQVAESSGQQQQTAEGDQVRVDDPGEARLGEAEVGLDLGKGDVHDRRVEDDHEHARAEDHKGDPARAVGSGRRLSYISIGK